MKKINKAILIFGVLFMGFISCKDDSIVLVPEWETAVNTFAKLKTGSSASFVNGSPTVPINLNWRWISIDGANTITKVEFFLVFNESYVDVDGNPALARHGGTAGRLFKTLEGAAVGGNRVDVPITVTQDDVYQLYKDNTFNYCKTTNPVPVFNNTLKPDRTPTSPFLAGDSFQLKWIIYAADGRKIDSWSPSVCTEFPGSNCNYGWGVVCLSELSGDYAYTTTAMTVAGSPYAGTLNGTGKLTESSEGSYSLTDFSFGLFGDAYGDNPAKGSLVFSDACNFISVKGVDQYGDSYTYTVLSVSGDKLTIQWLNTYGDGGTTVLTRVSGVTDWPALLTSTPSGSCN